MNASAHPARFPIEGCHILLVEDDPADAKLFEMATREVRQSLSVETVPDGAAALEYVYHRGTYTNAPPCTLIVLDLNLPGLDGFEVLRRIKTDSSTESIPVIVLSSTASPEDVKQAYAKGANAFLSKPKDEEDMVAMAKSFVHYWCDMVRLPERRISR
jgi:two-component system response regulator